MMKLQTQGRDCVLETQHDFNLKHIFECGQCFRWNPTKDGGYAGVVNGRYLHLVQEGEKITFKKTTIDDFNNIWRPYFDLERDYNALKLRIADYHPILSEAVEFGYGIRLLKQEPWETMISFIISANNNIPRIKMLIEKLAEAYGNSLGEHDGERRYGFPSPDQLIQATEQDLRDLGMGYRAKYIHNVTQYIVENRIDLETYQQWDTPTLEKQLLKFKGVGPKVASCIMIFGYGRLDSFPVDTWIRKVVSEWFELNPNDDKQLKAYLDERFQKLEGLVQQYLFYYAREHKLEIRK